MQCFKLSLSGAVIICHANRDHFCCCYYADLICWPSHVRSGDDNFLDVGCYSCVVNLVAEIFPGGGLNEDRTVERNLKYLAT